MFDVNIGEYVLIAGIPEGELTILNNKVGKLISILAVGDIFSLNYFAKINIEDEYLAEINMNYIFKIPKKKQNNLPYNNYYYEYFKDHQIIEYDIFLDAFLQHNIIATNRYGETKVYLTSTLN